MSDPDGRPWWAVPESGLHECALCGTPHTAHVGQETSGEVRHRWTSSSNEMHPVTLTSTAEHRDVARGDTKVVVAPAPDILLRRLLRDSGVITPEQYEGLFGA